MQCKVFHSKRHGQLEAEVNDWLTTHPRIWFPFGPQYTTCLVEDSVEYTLEHTLIIFYSTPDESDPRLEEEEEEEDEEVRLARQEQQHLEDRAHIGTFGQYIPSEDIPGYPDQILAMQEQRAGIL